MNEILTPEYQLISDEFQDYYEYHGCSCHNNPPCGYCVHPGNPLNLEDTPDAWLTDNSFDDDLFVIKP